MGPSQREAWITIFVLELLFWKHRNNFVNGSDIGIPNGPAEDSTQGLLKAHDPKNMKSRKPKLILRKVRIVIEVVFVILRGEL